MARARPSQAAVKNVIEALISCGMAPGAVRVSSDGSFTVEAQNKVVADPRDAVQTEPRRWGQNG